MPLNGQDRMACEDALLAMVHDLMPGLNACGPEHDLAYAVLLIRGMSDDRDSATHFLFAFDTGLCCAAHTWYVR